MAKRIYTDAEIVQTLAALRLNGGNVERTAAQVGVPAATLRGWARGAGRGAALGAALGREADNIQGALRLLRRADLAAQAQRLQALVTLHEQGKRGQLIHELKTWRDGLEREIEGLRAVAAEGRAVKSES